MKIDESPFESTEEPEHEHDIDTSDGPLDRLFDGDASGPSTRELQQEYGLDRNQSVAGRGILRVATGSGVPPVFEILFGSVMWVMQQRTNGSDESVPVDVDNPDDDPLGPGLDPGDDNER